jgi:metal-responsive CopG/Arc/MetJ family transcriptional regulator
VRLQPDLLAALDAWVDAQQDHKPSRPEAIRILLREVLEQR